MTNSKLQKQPVKIQGDDLLVFQTPAQAFGDKRKSTISLNAIGSSGTPPNDLSPATTGNFNHSRTSSYNALAGPNNSSTSGLQRHEIESFASPNTTGGTFTPTSTGQQQQQQSGNNPNRRTYKDAIVTQLRPLFDRCDLDHTGRLTQDELVHALRNYDGTEFNKSTVRQMIKSFDNSRTGSLDFEQFLALWDYLARWRTVFERFDVDKSLSISFNEYTSALKALGFSVEFNCLQHIFSRFSYLTPNQGPVMKLDSFVESMVWIMQITEDFKKFPSHDNGNTATISFSGFLDVILRHRA